MTAFGQILDDKKPSILLLGWLSPPENQSHLVTFVGNPSWKILYLNPLCQTLSKAFSDSRKDAITFSAVETFHNSL